MNSNQIVITADQIPGISTDIKMESVTLNLDYENDNSLRKSFVLTIDNIDYRTSSLSKKGNKGANSIILKLFLASDDNTDVAQRVLKVSKYCDNWTPKNGHSVSETNRSFYREIECLQKCKRQGVKNIIEIYSCGYLICRKKNRKTGTGLVYFPFYMMECANYDLKQFLEKQDEITKEVKVNLCYQLASGLEELHDIGCYHRDIKPDNVLLFGQELKIGDLGLIRYRNEDTEDLKSLIGPKGWISPEAMNKYLNEEKVFDTRINTEINEQSDIFQLGMVFWYIFQGNAPIGCIKRTDFFDKNEMIFSLIKRMIYHSTEKRIKSIGEVKDELSRILEKV